MFDLVPHLRFYTARRVLIALRDADMLKVSKPSGSAATSFTPNSLPCRIHQDGAVNASSRYWYPTKGAGETRVADLSRLSPCNSDNGGTDGAPEAYFRGRKLKGREVQVPEGYRGVVVKANGIEREVAKSLEISEGDEEPEEVKVLEELGDFDGIVAWGHESLVDGDDAFVRGLEEWVGFSQAVSCIGCHWEAYLLILEFQMHQNGIEGTEAKKGS